MELSITDLKLLLGVLGAVILALWKMQISFHNKVVDEIREQKETCEKHLVEYQATIARLYDRLIATGSVQELRSRSQEIGFEERRTGSKLDD